MNAHLNELTGPVVFNAGASWVIKAATAWALAAIGGYVADSVCQRLLSCFRQNHLISKFLLV